MKRPRKPGGGAGAPKARDGSSPSEPSGRPAPAKASPGAAGSEGAAPLALGEAAEGGGAMSRGALAAMSLAALGVVYGDIGTSPLYAVRECFHGLHRIAISPGNVHGVLSLIFWSLAVVVTIKYVVFILRVDNKGEGGIFALMALLSRSRDGLAGRSMKAVVLAGIFGAALLYGDGIITPAISVLSAVEGLEVATPGATRYVVPITCAVLAGLFFIQRRGTARIGKVFGPVMLLWFSALSLLGLAEVVKSPEILTAVNPLHAVRFFVENRMHGIVVLGSVVLCITGGEALYADLGHFNRPSIRLSWTAVVWPALLLNYFGQGAILLSRPETAVNPFYALAPRSLLIPLVVLATAATVIASQAMISGVYSLTQQAMQLGFLPRLRIVHTSSHVRGQIYLPFVNALLFTACVILVLAFKNSSGLAGAYGLAVTATMGITSILFFFVLTRALHRSQWRAAVLVGLFLLFDLSYFGANLLKLFDGGWLTLAVGAALTALMTSWRDGRAALAESFARERVTEEEFLDSIEASRPVRIPGTAVFMSVSPQGVPVALLHHYRFNHVLPQRILFVSLLTADSPTVPENERVTVRVLGQGFYRVIARMGYMETPRVPHVLQLAARHGLFVDPDSATYYLGRESLLTTGAARMSHWRKSLFVFMARNAQNPMSFFGIPPNRVVELGIQLSV